MTNKSVCQYNVKELIDGVLTKARSSNRHWINIDSLYLNLITLNENIIMLYLFKNCVNGPKKWLVTYNFPYLVGNIKMIKRNITWNTFIYNFGFSLTFGHWVKSGFWEFEKIEVQWGLYVFCHSTIQQTSFTALIHQRSIIYARDLTQKCI